MVKFDAKTANGDNTFAKVWENLTKTQLNEFWEHAAYDAKKIPRKSLTYKSLCIALHEVERKGPAKSAIRGLPPVPKQLSPLELQKAISD